MDGKYTATIGSDFTLKDYTYRSGSNSLRIRFMIYDLAGQPRYNAVRRNYLTGSHAGILVYDISNRESLDEIPNWLIQFKSILLATKTRGTFFLMTDLNWINQFGISSRLSLFDIS